MATNIVRGVLRAMKSTGRYFVCFALVHEYRLHIVQRHKCLGRPARSMCTASLPCPSNAAPDSASFTLMQSQRLRLRMAFVPLCKLRLVYGASEGAPRTQIAAFASRLSRSRQSVPCSKRSLSSCRNPTSLTQIRISRSPSFVRYTATKGRPLNCCRRAATRSSCSNTSSRQCGCSSGASPDTVPASGSGSEASSDAGGSAAAPMSPVSTTPSA